MGENKWKGYENIIRQINIKYIYIEYGFNREKDLNLNF